MANEGDAAPTEDALLLAARKGIALRSAICSNAISGRCSRSA